MDKKISRRVFSHFQDSASQPRRTGMSCFVFSLSPPHIWEIIAGLVFFSQVDKKYTLVKMYGRVPGYEVNDELT